MDAELHVAIIEWKEGNCWCFEVETAQDNTKYDRGFKKQELLDFFSKVVLMLEDDECAKISVYASDYNAEDIAGWLDETSFSEDERQLAIDDSVVVWRYNDESYL